MRRFVKSNSLELQFWGYEIGNIVAAIAGSGGFAGFVGESNAVLANRDLGTIGKVLELSDLHPDAFITIALGLVVIVVPVIRAIAQRRNSPFILNVIDICAIALSFAILAFTLSADTSWLTDAAAAFVVGSSLLRISRNNPFLMKPGGLALTWGGMALGAFGAIELAQDVALGDAAGLLYSGIGLGTGACVAAAGLLTWQGGIFETAAYLQRSPQGTGPKSWLDVFIDPATGVLARAFSAWLDPVVSLACVRVITPALFWIPSTVKQSKPFATSMWARLPWRFAAGALAFAAGTPQGLAFGLANICWAVGDIAIGSLDWEDQAAPSD
ncbi:hypothetical protein [Hoeflea sp. TYP-13]|uniref:hypothetical protein n=1 Tax=Hoeflea sp. TYP-13 TaxID=3230023 RepID=UPI0034C693D6